MQVLDYLCTPEGAMTSWYGLQGINWNYNADGTISFTDLGRECVTDEDTVYQNVQWTSPDTGKSYTLTGPYGSGKPLLNNNTWAYDCINPDSAAGYQFNWQFWKTEQQPSQYDIERNWQNYTNFNNRQEYEDSKPHSIIPATNYMQGKLGDLSAYWSQVTTAIKTGSWNAIMAPNSITFANIVTKMISDCIGYHYADCVAWSKNETQIKFGVTLNN